MINYYSPQDMTIWSGRVDDENDYESFRWHQWVKPLDLNDENLSPFDGKLGFGIIGFESDQGIELNKGRFGAAAGPAARLLQLRPAHAAFARVRVVRQAYPRWAV